MAKSVTEDDLLRIEKKLDRVLEALNGNGKPGILTRLALMEAKFKEWEKNADSRSSIAKGIVLPMLGQALSALVFFAAYLFAAHYFGILH